MDKNLGLESRGVLNAVITYEIVRYANHKCVTVRKTVAKDYAHFPSVEDAKDFVLSRKPLLEDQLPALVKL